MLHTSGRRHMRFIVVSNQLESRAEFVVEAVRVVLHHRQPATLAGSVRRKGGNDHVSARFHGMHHLPDVSAAIGFIRQEVKDRAIANASPDRSSTDRLR